MKHHDACVTGAAAAAYIWIIGWLTEIDERWFYWRNDEKLAAWVQAFGTIAALAIALYTASLQGRHDRELRRQADRLERVRQVRQAYFLYVGVAKSAADYAISHLKASFRPYDTYELRTSRLDEALRVLEQAVLLPFSSEVAVELVNLLGGLRMLRHLAETAERDGSLKHDRSVNIESLEQAKAQIERAGAKLRALAQAAADDASVDG